METMESLKETAILGTIATVLDDLESTRIAAENRLRQLTRTGKDKDGKKRGFELPEGDYRVLAQQDIVDSIREMEADQIKLLKKTMKKHYLWDEVSKLPGAGDKTTARLLSAIGDPYMRGYLDEDEELQGTPRSLSQLYAYCGFSTDDGQSRQRKKGVQSNWNDDAKKRLYLISTGAVKTLKATCKDDEGFVTHVENCACGDLRRLYDRRRAQTLDRVHAADCKRCGPSGNPAKAGSPWSAAHQHNDALRIVSKYLLKRLYIASAIYHTS